MARLVFVVQQYGKEMYGGAEFHCMRLAENLSKLHQVEVLTSCSFDFTTWEDYSPAGISLINGVTVRRFPVSKKRNWEQMTLLEKKIRPGGGQKGMNKLWSWFTYFFRSQNQKLKLSTEWVKAQGPLVPGLIDHLRQNGKDYDGILFFSYLYFPTVFGLTLYPAKSILVPLAHDEWAIRLPVFRAMFSKARYILYNTFAEQQLVNRLFHNEHVPSALAGIWPEIPVIQYEDIYKLYSDLVQEYILYVGRIDDNKLPDQDLNWFLKYAEASANNIQLVIIGKKFRELPDSKSILYLGFVDESTKFNLIKNALLLFQPSRFESLSMVLLEAFGMGVPVLVSKHSEVMKEHIQKSGGGACYGSYRGFKKWVNIIRNERIRASQMGNNGKKYAARYYSREIILQKIQTCINEIQDHH
jgi:glycosyltransferase involved in cell wall biosynthesis